MDALVAGERLVFGDFRLEPRSGQLFCRDAVGSWEPVPIGSRAAAVLCVLIRHPGAVVSKDAIMDAVWPGIAVEPNNLSVQIAALRRVLDDGRNGRSCIQAVPGRGYRLLLDVTQVAEAGTDPRAVAAAEPVVVPQRRAPRTGTRLWRRLAAGSGAVTLIALLVTIVWLGGGMLRTVVAPRLSLVVLPFQNLGDDPKDDYLADGITDDLTSDLSHIPGALVAARESAYTFKGKAVDVRRVGQSLGVRYVLEGSVRRIEDTLRINVQLTSAESGLHLWSDRFNERIADLNGGQERIVLRLGDQLGISLIEIENARSLRERPTNPDAFDLILRARAINHLPWSPQRNEEKLALFERALSLDPTSIYAMTGVAYTLADAAGDRGWGRYDDMQRAGRLLTQAQALAPASEVVLNTYVYWLHTLGLGRCPEIIELAERALRTDPNRMRVQTGIYNELATCKIWTGHADEALALQAEADRLNPWSPYKYMRYHQMGKASFLQGRIPEAVALLERAIAMNPNDQWAYRWLAAAEAMAGHREEAARYLAEASRHWPYETIRSYGPQGLQPSNVYAAQMRRFQEGMRLAGLRDHADEDADFGVPADGNLHSETAGYTATLALGATTIRTPELARLLAATRPVVIDAMTYSWGLSIPGAVGLKFAGLGGSFTDEAQDHLRSKVRHLTAGDLNHPVVAVGWNAERFDGRNLALRLVALGYTRVYWYRGGREAWEVAGLSESALDIQDW